jgi:hypothetical protein
VCGWFRACARISRREHKKLRLPTILVNDSHVRGLCFSHSNVRNAKLGCASEFVDSQSYQLGLDLPAFYTCIVSDSEGRANKRNGQIGFVLLTLLGQARSRPPLDKRYVAVQTDCRRGDEHWLGNGPFLLSRGFW